MSPITRAEQALRMMVHHEAVHVGLLPTDDGSLPTTFSCPQALVDMHGDLWTWEPASRWFSRASKWGAPRACFANALLACATQDDLRYVEGFAYCGQFAVHHAWAVDPDDVVVDFTWDESVFLPRRGRAYLGVPCPLPAAFDAVCNDQGYLETEEALSNYQWDEALPTVEARRYVLETAKSLST